MLILENRFFPLRSAACFLVEGALIFLSVITSFVILQESGILQRIDLRDAVIRGVVVAFFCQSCMYFLDLYDLKQSQTWRELFFSLMSAVGFVCIGIGLVSYVIPAFGVEGRMYYLTILLVAVFLLLWRLLFDVYLARYAPRQNILVVGTGEAAKTLADEILRSERLGFHLVGFADIPAIADVSVEDVGNVFYDLEDIPILYRNKMIDAIVVAITDRRGSYPVPDMLSLKVAGCPIIEWPEFLERLSGRIPIDNLSPSYFIFSPGFRKSRIVLAVRRVISLLASAAAIVLLAPVFLLVALVIRVDSPGDVIYTQERVGQNGRRFRIYKFRSMRQDAEAKGTPQWATKNDPRVTRIGKVLRLSRLDELPQLFNVLRGDLDLVGPRPERPVFVEELQKVIPYYSLRHTVKPGLTGWAQVMFTYCGTIEESREKLQYDLFYIKNMSIKLDLLILFRTLKIVILGRGAR